MSSRLTALLLAGSLAATAAGGYFTSQALSQTDSGKVVTIDVGKGEKGDPGPAGPAGPAGPKGEKGETGGTTCPAGFVFGRLIINHPGGQTTIFTCLEE
jgi:hypothetical protein